MHRRPDDADVQQVLVLPDPSLIYYAGALQPWLQSCLGSDALDSSNRSTGLMATVHQHSHQATSHARATCERHAQHLSAQAYFSVSRPLPRHALCFDEVARGHCEESPAVVATRPWWRCLRGLVRSKVRILGICRGSLPLCRKGLASAEAGVECP